MKSLDTPGLVILSSNVSKQGMRLLLTQNKGDCSGDNGDWSSPLTPLTAILFIGHVSHLTRLIFCLVSNSGKMYVGKKSTQFNV